MGSIGTLAVLGLTEEDLEEIGNVEEDLMD